MEIMEIIKNAFEFPSKDLGQLAIYIVLSIVGAFLGFGGLVSIGLGAFGNSVLYIILGVIIFVAALIIGFILFGYQVSIIKSGIDLDEVAPKFDWVANLIDGVKYLIVNIVYFIIPTIIVFIVALITNIPGIALAIVKEVMPYINSATTATANATANTTANTTALNLTTLASNSIIQALTTKLLVAFTVTAIVALVLFIIFTLIETMGVARLANTGKLGEAINFIEAFKDVGKVGWGKVIAVTILIFVIISLINIFISFLSNYVPGIGIVSIIVTPYLIFFASRAAGLLYSEIA